MNSPIRISRNQKKEQSLLHKQGVVLSWTRIHAAPTRFASLTPYIVVFVQLESGERTYGQLCDYEEADVSIGMRVVSILRRISPVEKTELIEYGIKFRPEAL